MICFYTLDIKTPVQLTTLNVKGTACDFFMYPWVLTMGMIFLRKDLPDSLNAVSHGKRVIYHG